jgi:hypothetical protein
LGAEADDFDVASGGEEIIRGARGGREEDLDFAAFGEFEEEFVAVREIVRQAKDKACGLEEIAFVEFGEGVGFEGPGLNEAAALSRADGSGLKDQEAVAVFGEDAADLDGAAERAVTFVVCRYIDTAGGVAENEAVIVQEGLEGAGGDGDKAFERDVGAQGKLAGLFWGEGKEDDEEREHEPRQDYMPWGKDEEGAARLSWPGARRVGGRSSWRRWRAAR